MDVQKLVENLEEVQKLIGKKVIVKTVNGEQITGILHAFDPSSGSVALDIIADKLDGKEDNVSGRRNLTIKIIPGKSVSTLNHP